MLNKIAKETIELIELIPEIDIRFGLSLEDIREITGGKIGYKEYIEMLLIGIPMKIGTPTTNEDTHTYFRKV